MQGSTKLSRRERQIMDVIYRRENATASDVLADLPDPPSYSAVRALLKILEDKGHLTHLEDGKRYVYRPTQPRAKVASLAIGQVIATFFGGSVEQAVATLISNSETELSDDELARLEELIHASQRSKQNRTMEEEK